MKHHLDVWHRSRWEPSPPSPTYATAGTWRPLGRPGSTRPQRDCCRCADGHPVTFAYPVLVPAIASTARLEAP